MFSEEELKELEHITPHYQEGVPICAIGCNGGFAWCKQGNWQIVGGPCVAGMIKEALAKDDEISMLRKMLARADKDKDEARRDVCELEVYSMYGEEGKKALLRKVAKDYDWEYLYPKKGKK